MSLVMSCSITIVVRWQNFKSWINRNAFWLRFKLFLGSVLRLFTRFACACIRLPCKCNTQGCLDPDGYHFPPQLWSVEMQAAGEMVDVGSVGPGRPGWRAAVGIACHGAG